LHLKSRLELIGFRTQEDLDPCLFISDKVICLVYVVDNLFFSPKEEYINAVIQQLRDNKMEVEDEGEVAGFLGVHISRRPCNKKVMLTQEGLFKHIIIIEAVGVLHLPIKHTPASPTPLVKDEDGDPYDGVFNYRSVIGMLQYQKTIVVLILLTPLANVQDLRTILGVHMKKQ
jgi:hypothetical protein